MKKEEKDHKKIHLLKKQVALMHGEHQEFDKEGFKNPSIFIVKNLTILVAISKSLTTIFIGFHDLGREL